MVEWLYKVREKLLRHEYLVLVVTVSSKDALTYSPHGSRGCVYDHEYQVLQAGENMSGGEGEQWKVAARFLSIPNNLTYES